MKSIMRSALLFALLLAAMAPAWAQAPEAVNVIGSGAVNALLEALAEATDQHAVTFDAVGTASGVDRFCSGDIDVATAARAMTEAEAAICGASAVAYSEFLVAHRPLAFVAQAAAPANCLSEAQMQAIFKPSASADTVDWSLFGDAEDALPLAPIVPSDALLEHAIADGLIPGDGLRRDARQYADAAEALQLLRETEGGLALIGWNASLALGDGLKLLEFSGGDESQCVSPSAESVEQDQYSAALSMVVYVNRARLAGNEPAQKLIESIIDGANAERLRQLGATAPSEAAYRRNADALAEAKAGALTPGETGFVMPASLSGSLRLVGAANAIEVLDTVAGALRQGNAAIEINLDLTGRAIGLAELCAGAADITLLDAALAEGDLEACVAGGIATTSAGLGAQATVLLGNAADEFAQCLTTDQVNAVWRAESAETLQSWSGVDPSFPDLGMTLFGLTLLDQASDILLQTAGAVIPPIRRDTEKHYDPLYRAAAVGNVPGALTYMNWRDYQRVLENEQANIQLVAVDAGEGCVTPSPATIADGSYALSRPATLLIRQEALAGDNTRAFLWSLFDAERWSRAEREGFVGLSALDLPGIRRDLQRAFAEAEALFPAANAAASEAASDLAEDESSGADAD